MRIRQYTLHLLLAILTLCSGVVVALGQEIDIAEGGAREVEVLQETCSDAKLYVIATAHLDTQWRWTIQETINEYIPSTLIDNFALLEKYPDYVFTFEGAYHYMLMKEYYGEYWPQLKKYIAEGRWRLAGSWLNAVDVNVTSSESLIRQALLGNGFYQREFGKTSRDVYLPDCFGFSYALPSIAAHCGLTGFSTQKLSWGSSVGTPFDIGLWQGVDGSALVAAVNPGSYSSSITSDLSNDDRWQEKIRRQYLKSNLCLGFKYFGTGDTGGAPDEESVSWLQRGLFSGGPIKLFNTGSDQLARDLTASLTASSAGKLAAGLNPSVLNSPEFDKSPLRRLPRYDGELLMTKHGIGCYTSQAAMKRWNRQNEILADAAERASVAAAWTGGAEYPQHTLNEAWTRFLWHQFHDDLTGTSIPEAYTFSWNDEIISQKQFVSVLTNAAGAVSQSLDTRVKGKPVVVYNPLAVERVDPVTAQVKYAGKLPRNIRVYGPDKKEVRAQEITRDDNSITMAFMATVPSVGFAVYDFRSSRKPCRLESTVSVSSNSLENSRYMVNIDSNGDVASVFDKDLNQELLTSPLTLQLLADNPESWSAWELDYDEVMADPYAIVGGPVDVQITENGPARVKLLVTRQAGGSTIKQHLSLAANGDYLSVETEVDWRTKGTLLKASFPLSSINKVATYDLGLGTIQRGINTPELFEVPAHRWADQSADDYGVTILSDCKYGWDKPDKNQLRLTLLHTPEVNNHWTWVKDEASQDLGQHKFAYGISGHQGDWRGGLLSRVADRFNQPLIAFQTAEHRGSQGKELSLLQVNNSAVAVRALKQAEESDEIVVRLQELYGQSQADISLEFASAVVAAREINGAEEVVGPAKINDGKLVTSLTSYQPRTFAIRLAATEKQKPNPTSYSLALPYNIDGISSDSDRRDGDFDRHGKTLAAELLPQELVIQDIKYKTGPTATGWANIVACTGQTINLPRGDYNSLYILATSVDGDRNAQFQIDDQSHKLLVHDYTDPVGQWENRLLDGRFYEDPEDIQPAIIKPADIAWVGTHSHAADGLNKAYEYTHIFKYCLELPRKSRQLTLPDDESIRILAISVADNQNIQTSLATPQIDKTERTGVRIHARQRDFIDSREVTLSTLNAGAVIHFTTDGNKPTATSPVYSKPLTITENTTLKARAILPGIDSSYIDSSYIATAQFNQVVPRPGILVKRQVPGLVCRYYQGEWENVPAFPELPVAQESIELTVGLPDYVNDDHFGVWLSGMVQIPTTGLYTFHLYSDDGSVMTLGGEMFIDNDGLHGRTAETADVALQAGLHRFQIQQFELGGDANLELWIEGPGLDLQQVPAEMLYH